MRTSIFIIILFTGAYFAQSQTRFESAIVRGKTMLSEATTAQDYQAAANYFERIRQKEQNHWLPQYYLGLSKLRAAMATETVEEKSSLILKALEHAQEAHQLDANAEVLVLEGFVQMMRLTLDPATYGQTLSPVIFGLYQEALAKEPQNPRALLMLGQMQYGTAGFFGSGYEEACQTIQKAYDIFGQTDDNANGLMPSWGMGQAKASLARCNQ